MQPVILQLLLKVCDSQKRNILKAFPFVNNTKSKTFFVSCSLIFHGIWICYIVNNCCSNSVSEVVYGIFDIFSNDLRSKPKIRVREYQNQHE